MKNMGEKYLSEVIEEHKEEIIGKTDFKDYWDYIHYTETKLYDSTKENENNLILITAGVGAGKNTWIQKCLTKELHGFEKILFITSRKLIKEQMLKDINFSNEYIVCKNYGLNYVITHHSLKEFFRSPEALEKLNELGFRYIVIDEVHSLIADAGYTDTAFYLYSLLQYYHAHGIKIICLSATTKNVLPFFEHFKNFKHFDFTDECKNVKPKSIKVISKAKAFQLLSQANSENKMIYMANSVTDICNSYYKKLIKDFNVDTSSIGIIISDSRCKTEKSNTKNDKLKLCLNNMPFLVDYIVKQETLPENINIVLATSRIREGINIKDDNITAMFCEAHDIIDIAQFSGRYRGNLETLYIIHDTKAHYRKEDIENLELEYNFLSSFELVNINIYSSILLYKATGIKTPYLNDKNYNYYNSSITSLPTDLLEEKISFLETGNKSEKQILDFDQKYYLKAFNNFQKYIQQKYPLLEYNIILQKYELYLAKYYYIKEEYNNYINYKKDPVTYLKGIFQIDNIELDNSIDKITSEIKEENKKIILSYLQNNNYLNTILSREKQNDILFDIQTLPDIYLKQNYSTLGILLKAHNIKTQRKGSNKDGNIIILTN